jgi:hypothetical protein
MTNEKTHYKKCKDKDPNLFGSHELMNDDLSYREMDVTLTSVVWEYREIMGSKQKKKFANFKEIKSIVVNAEISAVLKDIFNSPFLEDWKNKRVTLYVKKGVKYMGELYDVIRIKTQLPTLPQLTPESNKWQGCVDKLKNGTSIETIKGYFTLTAENEALILKQANETV